MGIFSSIKDFLFGKKSAPVNKPSAQAAPNPGTPSPTAPAAAPATASIVMEKVDIEAILDREARDHGQNLNWRQSIVDLMKLCNIDSSLAHRKELAQELGYTGDMNDSATMNIWLHKAVMRKLEDSGGKVPAELKD